MGKINWEKIGQVLGEIEEEIPLDQREWLTPIEVLPSKDDKIILVKCETDNGGKVIASFWAPAFTE